MLRLQVLPLISFLLVQVVSWIVFFYRFDRIYMLWEYVIDNLYFLRGLVVFYKVFKVFLFVFSKDILMYSFSSAAVLLIISHLNTCLASDDKSLIIMSKAGGWSGLQGVKICIRPSWGKWKKCKGAGYSSNTPVDC